MAKKGYKRRRYLVHEIQKKYAVIIALLLTVYTVLLALFLFVPPAIKLISDVSLREKGEAATRFLVLAEHLWPAIIASIVIIAIISIVITHRLAGPLYRFEATAQRIIDGDLSTRIKLREKDDLARFAELFNQAIDNINGAMVEMRKSEAEMGGALNKVQSDSVVKEKERLLKDIVAVAREREKMAAVLERFDLSERS
ncbi:MAG: hypothetical protein ACE5GF_05340 [Thermodesulfobacteriota bacterium]